MSTVHRPDGVPVELARLAQLAVVVAASRRDRDHLVRAAIAQGISATEVAQCAALSRRRVYQILKALPAPGER